MKTTDAAAPNKEFKNSSAYRTGQMYAEYGRLLMNPETTIKDLADFGTRNGLEVDIIFKGIEQEPQEESGQ